MQDEAGPDLQRPLLGSWHGGDDLRFAATGGEGDDGEHRRQEERSHQGVTSTVHSAAAPVAVSVKTSSWMT